MALEANPNELYLGRGKLYFDRFDSSGKPTGYRFLGNCSKLELTPNVTVKEFYEHTRSAALKIANIPVQQKHTLAIDMSEGFQPDNAALALLGDTASLSSTSPTIVTEEPVAASSGAGRVYRLQNRNISGLAISAGGTPLVEDTDFSVINPVTGMVHILTPQTAAITANYNSGTVAAMQMRAGLTANIRGSLIFEGDPANGPILDIQFWIVQIQPSAAIALITDDFATLSIAGECLADAVNHPESPIYTITRTGVTAGG